MHALGIFSDWSGCRYYRLVQPFNELKRFGVRLTSYPYLPTDPTMPPSMFIDHLLKFIYPYDFVILQRCNKLAVAAPLRQACDILGKKLVFETDDDYLHVPEHSPCAADFRHPQRIYEFLEILKMSDLITVTTEELKNLYYKYNRNIAVLPNNVEEVHYFKDYGDMPTDEKGGFEPIRQNGFVHMPAYVTLPNGAKCKQIRIGYTGTITHRVDFNTIKTTWFKTLKKFREKSRKGLLPNILVIYIGDDYFPKLHMEEMGDGHNMMFIAPSEYSSYYYNIRNLDIGIAPLEINIFNMSKSPIKAVEYASWGIPAVLPNYITYDREFVDNKTCLMYNNQQEFGEQLERLVENADLRTQIGNNARAHVAANRTEEGNASHRFEIYQNLLNISRPIKIYKPKEKKDVQEVQAAS